MQTTNTYDAKLVEGYVRRLNKIEDDVLSSKGRYMQEVRVLREDRLEILQEADSNGLSRKALKAFLKEQRLEKQLDAVRDELVEDDQHALDMIRQALGLVFDEPQSGYEAAMSPADEVAAKREDNARQRAETKRVEAERKAAQ